MLKHLRVHPLFVNVKSHKSQNIKTERKRKLDEDNCTILKKNPGIEDAFEKIHSFQGNGFRSDSTANPVIHMICKDLAPISIFEKPGFLKLMKTCVPLYQVQTKNIIIRRIKTKYALLKEKLVNEFKKVNAFVMTSDVWTDCNNTSYMGFSAHYLCGMSIKTFCLACESLNQRHTADYLKNTITIDRYCSRELRAGFLYRNSGRFSLCREFQSN
ncbi:hypothetical protein TKK_0007503 [Trichogramma kaykai]